MFNSGLKQYKRRRDLCHVTQSLSKVSRSVVTHSFDPHLSTLYGPLITHLPPASVRCAYLNAFKDKLNILPSGKYFDSVCER
jgi:hypothetical protein